MIKIRTTAFHNEKDTHKQKFQRSIKTGSDDKNDFHDIPSSSRLSYSQFTSCVDIAGKNKIWLFDSEYKMVNIKPLPKQWF